jgi:GntR family transcriptional regulator
VNQTRIAATLIGMSLDRSPAPAREGDGASRHASIAATLRAQIDSGELPAGAPLPSEAQLSARFEVSRGTVRQALAALRSEGLIAGGRGRPPTVARQLLAQSFDQFVSFSMWAERAGHEPAARTLELARRPADVDAALALGLEPGAPVFQYKRVRLLDGVPMMIELSTFVEHVGRLLLDCDLDGGSVYAQLGDRGVRVSEAQQTIAAIAANAEYAALLEVPRRAPLLEVRRLVLGPEGERLEWSYDIYRGDSFAITIHNHIALPRTGVRLSHVTGA